MTPLRRIYFFRTRPWYQILVWVTAMLALGLTTGLAVWR